MVGDFSLEKKLNKEQLEAVTHKKGPLLIVAGAGTGKTTVVTERIKYLIANSLATPSEILALTFTEKAAREMEERVDVALPYGYTQMWISTFHSFGDRILRSEALHIGLDPRYKLMTEAETIQFVRKNLFEFDLNYFRPLGNPTKFVSGILQHFSRLQDEDITPYEYLHWVESLKNSKSTKEKYEEIEIEKWSELARAYRKYDELKIKEGVLDYGDLIVKTLKLFRERPNVLKEYQRLFKYILVDEFQDTNIAQNELIKLLAGKEENITVVLDDDQSIYRFRGAAVSNALYFRKNFPNAKVVTLVKNYRSSQEILDKAYKLIQHNNPDRLEVIENIEKRLIAQRKDVKSEVKFIHSDRIENEAEEVARKIKDLVNEEGYQWKDIAVLVRANNHSDPFIRAFQRNAIPYQFLGPGRLFRQPEIVDLISYLKVLYDYEDSVSLYKLLSIEHFNIPAKDLIRLSNYARKQNLSLFDALEKIDDIFVSEETRLKVKKILKIIKKHLEYSRKESAGQILYYFLQDTGLLEKLLNPDTPSAEKKALNISKFFDKLKTYEIEHEDATVPAVVDWIDLSSELGESPLSVDLDWTKENAVNILTVHSSKGLEFPVVFLVNLVVQRFPTTERSEQIPIPEELIKEILPKGDYHIQEERRLFYVGMTRAMDRLYLTAANYYGEGKRERRLSPFIFEALGEEAISREIVQEKGKQLSFLDYKPAEKIKEDSLRSTNQPIHIDYLSYSQIEAFQTCPLHFKLKYIYRIPTPPSASQSFGTSIHETIKDFYTFVKNGSRPSEDLILKLLEENWIRVGFTSKSHEKKFFEKAKIYLLGFLKVGFDPKNLPVLMEQKFTLPLPRKKGEKPLLISGVMDRVDQYPNGTLEIIDYKTGATIPTQREVDQNLQLTFYALAATSIPEEPFKKLPKDVKLSLYFLDTQEKFTTQRTTEDLKRAVDSIYELRREIEESTFECSGNILCERCEFSLFCRMDKQ